MTTQILTRAACAAQLPDGSDNLAVTLHVARTAGMRHYSRVAAVHAALDAAYPSADAEVRATILTVELAGVGGPGGYSGDATARMSWAVGLGKGRRQASDGAAWTAAIGAARAAIMGAGAPAKTAASVEFASEWIRATPSDLQWPLAYCLRRVTELPLSDRDMAAEWCRAARAIALSCEPDTAAGRLAQRYGLATHPYPLCSHELVLSSDTIGALLGHPGWHAPTGGYTAEASFVADEDDNAFGGLIVTLSEPRTVLVSEAPTGNPGDWNSGWLIRVSTRASADQRGYGAVRRAWLSRRGADETEAIAGLHVALAEGFQGSPADMATVRESWRLEDGEVPPDGLGDSGAEPLGWRNAMILAGSDEPAVES